MLCYTIIIIIIILMFAYFKKQTVFIRTRPYHAAAKKKKHECCLIINTNSIDYYYCIFVHVKLLLICLRPHGSGDYPCPRDRVNHYLVGEMKGWSGNALIWCPSTVFLANSCSIQHNHRVHRTFIYNVLLLLIVFQ